MTWEFDDHTISDTGEVPFARPAPRSGRPIFGYVYELFTTDQPPDSHAYAGLVRSPKTIAERADEHRGEAHKHPWKAFIRPGRAGYRILERVYATGYPDEDEARLRRAESDWIDRLRTLHNGVRPVRPPVHEGVRFAADAKPQRPAARRRPSRARRRSLVFAVLFVLATVPMFVFVQRMNLPWPAAPWIVAPIVGGATAYRAFVSGARLLGIRLRG